MSDADLVLTAGDARLTVDPAVGGRMTSLVVGGHELLVTEGYGPIRWGCYPMAPFAGRIRDGRFGFRGRTVQLPLRSVAPDAHPWAEVTFINRTTNAMIATVTVTLTNADDTSTGVAEYDWTVDIGTAKSKSYRVGMIVSDYYSRNSTADDATITVSKQR